MAQTSSYKEELQKAMNLLADEGYLFLGQNMRFGGTSMFHSIKHVDESRRIELPVFEETQMGMSLGMSLTGLKVCSVYPRMDFLICAINQLVNHLDKVSHMSDDQFSAPVIIRACIGSTKPLMPGCQHSQDYTEALKLMCKHIEVVKLDKAEDIVPAYKKAMKSKLATVIIEEADLYNSDLIKDLKEARAKPLIK